MLLKYIFAAILNICLVTNAQNNGRTQRNLQRIRNIIGGKDTPIGNAVMFLSPKVGNFIETLFKKRHSYNKAAEEAITRTEPKLGETKGTIKIDWNRMFDSLGFSSKKRIRTGTCKDKGGVIINTECVKYFGENQFRDYQGARGFCEAQGGDLWTPDLTDPFLYQKIMKFMPQVSKAIGKNFWIGMQQLYGRAVTLTGEDMTDAYLVQISETSPNEGQCFVLDFPNGQFKAKGMNCRSGIEFACEFDYNLEAENEIEVNNHI